MVQEGEWFPVIYVLRHLQAIRVACNDGFEKERSLVWFKNVDEISGIYVRRHFQA